MIVQSLGRRPFGRYRRVDAVLPESVELLDDTG